MANSAADAPSFSWVVDSAIASESDSNMGESRFHSFATVVDSAIRSSTATEADLETSPIHYLAFASAGDRKTAVAAPLPQAVSDGIGHFTARLFTLPELKAAANNFSLQNKIGVGSFGVMYKGKLADGREVAIKRRDTSLFFTSIFNKVREERQGEQYIGKKISKSNTLRLLIGGFKTKKFQEKESAFESELAFLSRLHHKHLVGPVGFCEEKDERLFVYEYMKNGSLHDHLHDKNNVEKGSSVLNYWKMRIKIALDSARGIEYLHNYAVPSIIHRDIKSSNILIDATWTARVSDFGLSLVSPEPDRDYRQLEVVGTLGYIDPEYFSLNILTEKSDVYGLGVVLLELLTGKRVVLQYDEDGGTPLNMVTFAVPRILAGELEKILDPRVGPPYVNEAEAVELVAYTAIHCVNLEGKDRPTMADIVVNLERALAVCESSHDSISSGPISVVSE